MNMRKCIYKFVDEGCLCGITLDIDSSNNYLATGFFYYYYFNFFRSKSGIVNLYDFNYIQNLIHGSLNENIKPLKSIMNLTTATTVTKFNSTGYFNCFI